MIISKESIGTDMATGRDNTCSQHKSNQLQATLTVPIPLAVAVADLFAVPLRLPMSLWNIMDAATQKQLICDIVEVGRDRPPGDTLTTSSTVD